MKATAEQLYTLEIAAPIYTPRAGRRLAATLRRWCATRHLTITGYPTPPRRAVAHWVVLDGVRVVWAYMPVPASDAGVASGDYMALRADVLARLDIHTHRV